MPGKVKVKVLAGRNLPVMDRSNDTTDAYVEVKLGNATCKTDVCRKSLNPQWNSEWFRFEMDDLELQDEPLQIRLMDYDTYSANDSIGRVYIDLNPLLTNPSKTKEPSGRTMSGWIPVYDTMHGIRGEVNLTVKVELFSDLNKFRQSSCGVKFFFTQGIPEGHLALQLHGFVEELVVNDDPEYQWIDKIRTPRASNEARQTLFSKLSGEVQRRVGLKALELGGNAVIGYRQCFDLEGESGIVVRGIGTASTLAKIHDHISSMPTESINLKECQSKDRQLAAVSIPKPSSQPNFSQKPCSSSQNPPLSNKSPVSHSSMPESVLRSLCIQDNPNSVSEAFDVPYLSCIPTSLAVSVNEPCASTSTTAAVKPFSSALTLKDIKSGDESPVPFITSPLENEDNECIEFRHVNFESFVTPEKDTSSSSAAAVTNNEFPGLVLKTSDSIRKGLGMGMGGHEDKYFQAQKRGRGSKKKDKYSTSSLVKRVNATFPEKATSFLFSKDKIKGEVMNFFSKKWKSQRERSPEFEDMDEVERDPSPGYSSVYREPKFKRNFLFFRKKKRRSSCGSSRRSNFRRSLSDSLSLDRNSLESLPSIQSEDLGYKPDWTPIPVSMRMSTNKDPAIRSKVFDPNTVIPESSQPSLSISSQSSEQGGNNMNRFNNSKNDDIIKVIRELGYSHAVEKPLRLYISSLDALLVYEPVVKNENEIDELKFPSPSECCNAECDSTVTPACSVNYTISKNNTRDTSCQIAFNSSLSHNECENTNLGGDTPPSATSIITTHTTHADTNTRIASEFNESMSIPHMISCTAPINTPSSGLGTVIMLEDPTTSSSPNQYFMPEDPKDIVSESSLGVNGIGTKERNESGKENGNGVKQVRSGHSIGTSLMTTTSSASSISAIPVPPVLSQMLESNNKFSLISSNTTKVSARSAASVTAGFSGRRSSESDLSTPPKGLLNSSIQAMLTSSHGKGTSYAQSRGRVPQMDHFDMLEYPFITISSLPPRFLQRIGGSVTARSVKVLQKISNLEEPESRDSWWTELRMEIRAHARSMQCNVILGYEEHTSICDDVCILTSTGTAAVVNSAVLGDMTSTEVSISNKPHLAPVPEVRSMKGSKEHRVPPTRPENSTSLQNGLKGTANPSRKSVDECEWNCSLCHSPYEDFQLPFPVKMGRCGICKKGRVPDLIIVTVDLPPNLPICGKICLIHAQICRSKRDLKGESCAKEVSDGIPFIEYELHRRLVTKLKVKGMNAIFCLKLQICVGEKMMVGVATGTAVCLAGLPPPELPKIIAGNAKTDPKKVIQYQKVVRESYERNRKFYMIDSGPFAKYHNGTEAPDTDEDEDEDVLPPLNLATGNKDTYVLEVDDCEDIEIITALVDQSPPIGCEMNTMDNVLEYDDVAIVSQQMFTQVWRCRLQNLTLNMLATQFDKILRAVTYKLRNISPCVVNKLRFHLELPDCDEMQFSITGTAFGLVKKPSSQASPIPSSSAMVKEATMIEPEMIFNLECDRNSNGRDLTGSSNLKAAAPLPPISSTNVVSPSSSVSPPLLLSSSSNEMSTNANVSPSTTAIALNLNAKTSTMMTNSSPITTVIEPINSNSNVLDTNQISLPTTISSSSSPQFRLSVSPQLINSTTPIVSHSLMPGCVPPLSKTVFRSPSSSKGSYVIEMTTLSHIPGYHIEKYLGNLNFFFIRETTSIKEMGGPTGFLHNLIVEVMTVLRAHVAALGGNALVSYFLNELSLLHNPHKNQGQCLINIGGDAVLIIPMNQEELPEAPRTNP